MAAQTQLHVRIAADGTVSAETRNVTGSACLDYVSVLEDLLEATAVDSAYTADYTRTEKAQTENVQTQGTRDELRQS